MLGIFTFIVDRWCQNFIAWANITILIFYEMWKSLLSHIDLMFKILELKHK